MLKGPYKFRFILMSNLSNCCLSRSSSSLLLITDVPSTKVSCNSILEDCSIFLNQTMGLYCSLQCSSLVFSMNLQTQVKSLYFSYHTQTQITIEKDHVRIILLLLQKNNKRVDQYKKPFESLNSKINLAVPCFQ